MDHDRMYELTNKVARSTVAVIDALTQRGGFKGEELLTIGQLRQDCIEAIQAAETYQQEKASSN